MRFTIVRFCSKFRTGQLRSWIQKLDSTLKVKPATSSAESGVVKVKRVLKGDKIKKAVSLNAYY